MSKGWRKIVIGEKEWKYQIGKDNVVARCGSVVETIDYSKLNGISWDDIERACWKKNFHITPKVISEWISNI